MMPTQEDETPEELSQAKRIQTTTKKVTIVVLGDIGRSPRMGYHALSLVEEGYFVHLIGYGESPLPSNISNNKSIWVDFMPPVPLFIQSKINYL